MKHFLYIILLILIVLIGRPRCNAQSWQKDLRDIKEKLHVVTDRSIYCVGEFVHFRIFNNSTEEVLETEWSKVVYVELITHVGTPVFQGKYFIGKDGAHGDFKIPKFCNTGNYYIKTYTKWMRNFSQYNYCFKTLTIINPYKSDILSSSPEKINYNSEELSKQALKKWLTLHTDKKEYQKREQVELTLQSTSNNVVNVSISIVKGQYVENDIEISVPDSEKVFSGRYVPETRGISISGKVVSSIDSVAMPHIPVYITIFDQQNKILSRKTDESGRFYFSFPELIGEKDIYIVAYAENDSVAPGILIDNDFCSRPLQLPCFLLDTSNNMRDIYTDISINTQVSERFVPVPEKKHTSITIDSAPFYGYPDFKIDLKDYIELPTVYEYIYELLPNITVRKKKNKSSLRVITTNPEMRYYSPLVLLDMVPLDNLANLFQVDPVNLRRIEVVDEPYFYCDNIYGGIISFFSKQGDLAGVSLPPHGKFLKFKFEHECEISENVYVKNKHFPDMRNCLYWNPLLKIAPTKGTKVQFFTGDISGEYKVLVRSLSQQGKIQSQALSFVVK